VKETILNKVFLHGADYNPEQWFDRPDILERDIEMMKEANCNVMSVGIFSWSVHEPEEGKFELDWLEKVLDKLYENGIYAVLATPSGARPRWMAQKYPEVLRVNENLDRNLMGDRHNHCYTSPIYREKTAIINRMLAERFAEHPGVILWHLSNEYCGICYCPLCQEAFRNWIKKKYETLDNLNSKWWTAFWSHTYTDWSQVESPIRRGEGSINALKIDWDRFCSDQTIDFMQHEIDSVKSVNPNIPVTTNLMYHYGGIDGFKLGRKLDIVSWDAYPEWHMGDDVKQAINFAFYHDLMRSILNKPFLLMESTPSTTNWKKFSKMKKLGFHVLSSMLAVAHGSNSVQYFQWRQSRGCSEKFHSAVVSHYGGNDDRVFQDVCEMGKILKVVPEITQTATRADVCLIYDWENRWGLDHSNGPRNFDKGYIKAINEHYSALRKLAVMVDVTDMEGDISSYKMVVAPMLYMYRAGFAGRIRAFVENGGTFVGTYWSGIVNEFDLTYLGGMPGELTDVFGLRSTEIDALGDEQRNAVIPVSKSAFCESEYPCFRYCDVPKVSTADVLLTYKGDYYAGEAALTVNKYGKGKAFYMATAFDAKLLTEIYGTLVRDLKIEQAAVDLPHGVLACLRENDKYKYVFYQNFNDAPAEVVLPQNAEVMLGGAKMPAYGVTIVKRVLPN